MHVDFLSLKLENTMCFKEAYLPLKDQGLVNIRGVNLDEGGSNGSGKTTLFEMLVYLFYDKLTKTDRRVKKSDLLNSQHPSDFLIRAEFVREGVPFVAEKFRKVKKRGSGIDIWEDGQRITLDDPREAQKVMASLLGRSWNEVLGSVYLSQRHTHRMIEGTPAEKEEYISKYFGLDTLDSMITTTEKRIKSIPLPDETYINSLLESVDSDLEALGDVDTLSSSYSLSKEEQSSLQEKLVSARVSLGKQEEAKETQEESKSWKKFLSSKFSLRLRGEEVKSALRDKRNELKELVEEEREAKALLSIEEELARLGSVDSKYSSESIGYDLSESIMELEKRLPLLEGSAKLARSLKGIPKDKYSVDGLRKRKEKWAKKEKEASSTLSATLDELRRLSKVGDVCYTCLRPISPSEKSDMRAEREKLKEEFEQLSEAAEEALSSYSGRLGQAEERTRILRRLDDIGDVGDDSVSEVEGLLSAAKEEYCVYKSMHATLVRVRVLLDKRADLPPNQRTLDEIQKDRISVEEDERSLDDAHQWLLESRDIVFSAREYQTLTEASSVYKSRLKELDVHLIELNTKLTQARSLFKQKKDLEKTLSKASAEKTRVQVLRYITITLGELKKLGLREATKLLSGALPMYLDQLFPDGDISLTETDDANGFDLVFNKGGKTLPLTLISGGQAKRVGLAIVFAFAKMGRNTTNILICDEPFRDLDKKGKEACFELLRDFDIGTLLVTSHDQDITSSRKYDQVWTVQMKNHVSTLYLDT